MRWTAFQMDLSDQSCCVTCYRANKLALCHLVRNSFWCAQFTLRGACSHTWFKQPVGFKLILVQRTVLHVHATSDAALAAQTYVRFR